MPARRKHRELRRRAEDAQARRRAARRADAERVRRAEAALKAGRALRAGGTARSSGGLDPAISGRLRRLMEVTALAARERRRLRRLALLASAQVPTLTSYGGLAFLALVSRQPWARLPQQFRAPAAHPTTQHTALLRHLLVRWPVPDFLLDALEPVDTPVIRLPLEQEWLLRLVARLGQGGSLTESGLLPAPLTRRMRALFLQAPRNRSPVAALRYAQILGAGGSRALLSAVLSTRLARLQGSQERWWHAMLGWITSRDNLPDASVPELIGWLHRVRASGDDYDPRGRPTAAVLRHLEARAAQLTEIRAAGSWEPSGLAGLDQAGRVARWTITELRTPAALCEEGRVLSHCAWSYRHKVAAGEVALFSLRRNGVRRGTIEVSLAWGQLCQARGKANRPLSAPARTLVRQWARQNGLCVTIPEW